MNLNTSPRGLRNLQYLFLFKSSACDLVQPQLEINLQIGIFPFIGKTLRPLENLGFPYAFSFVVDWTSLSKMDSDLEAISHYPTNVASRH